MKLFMFLSILSVGRAKRREIDSQENLPTSCHVCKHTVTEFLEELDHSANSRDVLELGQVLQSEKPRKIVYNKSGLRLIEALDNTCKKIKDYKVHKDKPNHLRYAKDESTTFTTLKNLKKRGVKVDLGFPDEMWDSPDAEIVELKRQCENIVEKYEEYLNDWYFNHQENDLFDWFCKDHVLKGQSHNCLEGPNHSDDGESRDEDENKRNGSGDDEREELEDKELVDEKTRKKKRDKKSKMKYNEHDDEKEQEEEKKKKKKLKNKGEEEEEEEEKKNKRKRKKEKKQRKKYQKTKKSDEMPNEEENEKKHHSEL